MTKTIATKTILFLAVICLLFQLVPTDLNAIDSTQIHTKESNSFIKSRPIDDYPFLAVRLNKKVSFQNISIKSPLIIVYKTSVEDAAQIYSFLHEDPFDYRKVIRKFIPHYFNGSKYKSETFSI